MPESDNFQYEIDGQIFPTSDGIVTGRAIRAEAGLNPVSDYVLIELGNQTSRSVGLEEEIDLAETPSPRFRSFRSDRAFSLTVNERGYEWGEEAISTSDLRAMASIPEGHELILDSKGDRALDDDKPIRLKPKGVERILSRERETICIFINTVEEYVEPGKISFSQLAKLAFPDLQITENTEFTVTYRKGHDAQPAGSLIEGESVKVKKGMIFDVTATDKS